jgi:hypothetical protein
MVYQEKENCWRATSKLIANTTFATYQEATLGECIANIYPSDFNKWYEKYAAAKFLLFGY